MVELGLVVYTTSNCPRCKLLKKWLGENKIAFEERNMEDSEVAADLTMRDVYVLAAPILESGGALHLVDELFCGDELNEKSVKQLVKEIEG